MKKKKRPGCTIMLLLVLAAAAVGIYLHFFKDGGHSNVFSPSTDRTLTLIVDAGHGGSDGGASSDNGLQESIVNLDIALKVDALAAFFGVRTVMTREAEDINYSSQSLTLSQRKSEDQNARLSLINSTKNAVFLSIHQNYYPDPQPFGAQALYAGTEGSEQFGKNLQELMVAHLIPGNRRAAEQIQSTIYLMNNIECPAVLVECAFLSNPEEEALLRTDAYKTKLAVVLVSGFLQNQLELGQLYGLDELT